MVTSLQQKESADAYWCKQDREPYYRTRKLRVLRRLNPTCARPCWLMCCAEADLNVIGHEGDHIRLGVHCCKRRIAPCQADLHSVPCHLLGIKTQVSTDNRLLWS